MALVMKDFVENSFVVFVREILLPKKKKRKEI
jgi:hypothetical protein